MTVFFAEGGGRAVKGAGVGKRKGRLNSIRPQLKDTSPHIRRMKQWQICGKFKCDISFQIGDAVFLDRVFCNDPDPQRIDFLDDLNKNYEKTVRSVGKKGLLIKSISFNIFNRQYYLVCDFVKGRSNVSILILKSLFGSKSVICSWSTELWNVNSNGI